MDERTRPLAVVTGGSSGIGLELARELARRGHDLVIGGQDKSKLVLAAAELKEQGVKVECINADLTRADEVERFYREASAVGPIEVFCANAGVGCGGGDFTETDLQKELRLIDLNVRSQVHLTKLILPSMVERGRGHILVTASIASLMPGPFESVYAASKAFIRSFGEALRNEVADKGVVVTVLKPGPTETDFFRRAGMIGTPAGDMKNKDDPASVARQGIDALFKDKHHVVSAGLMTKAQAATTPLMSDPALAVVHRMQTEPKDRKPEKSGGIGAAPVAGGVLLAAAGVAAAVALRKRVNERDDVDRYEEA